MTFATKVVKQKGENKYITGTGTAGQNGSASAAYVPTLWTFNIGMTPVEGDVVMIKVPKAGVNSGVWMSVDNGTNYYPVAVRDTTRFTTHYPINEALELVFETGLTTAIYGTSKTGAAAGAGTTNWTGGRWSVVNYRDTDTTSTVNQTAALANTNTSKYTLLHAQNTGTGNRNGYAVYKSTVTYQPSTQDIFIHDKPALYGTYSSTTPSSPVTGQIWLKQTDLTIEEAKVLVLTGSLSSLPVTIPTSGTDSRITSDMVVVNSMIGNYAAMAGDWKVSTSDGTLVISGPYNSTIASTTYALYLMKSR